MTKSVSRTKKETDSQTSWTDARTNRKGRRTDEVDEDTHWTAAYALGRERQSECDTVSLKLHALCGKADTQTYWTRGTD